VQESLLKINPSLKFETAGPQAQMTWETVLTQTMHIDRENLPCGACEDLDNTIRIVNLAGHDQTFQTVCVQEQGGVIWSQAHEWLKSLLESKRVMQVKGYLAIDWEEEPKDPVMLKKLSGTKHKREAKRKIAIYGMKGNLEIKELQDEPAHRALEDCELIGKGSVEHGCKLFLLGKGLQHVGLEEGLRSCMVPPNFVPVADLDLDFPEAAALLAEGNSNQVGTKAVSIDLTDEEMPEIALFWVNGFFFAMPAKCPHAKADLSGGQIEDWEPCNLGQATEGQTGLVSIHKEEESQPVELGPTVMCPAHMYVFDLMSGKSVSSEYVTDVFPVWVTGGIAFLGKTPNPRP